MGEGRTLIAAAQKATSQRVLQELAALSISAQAASSAREARQMLESEGFSTLLIFLPLPEDGCQLALDAARHSDCAIVLIGQEDYREEASIRKAREAGALFAARPLNREKLRLLMESAQSIHLRIQYLKKENALLQRKVQEIKTVERAKYLLMQLLGMTEAQAHHFIEKQAMDTRQPRAEVALRILKTYESS